MDGVQGQADLLAFGREADHAAAVGAVSREAVGEQQRLARASALGGALAGLGADLTAVAVLALAIPSVREGRLDGVQLAVVTLLTLAAFEAVATLPAAWTGMAVVRRVGDAGSSRSRTSRPRSSSPPAPARAGRRGSSRCATCASPTRASPAPRSTA